MIFAMVYVTVVPDFLLLPRKGHTANGVSQVSSDLVFWSSPRGADRGSSTRQRPRSGPSNAVVAQLRAQGHQHDANNRFMTSSATLLAHRSLRETNFISMLLPPL